MADALEVFRVGWKVISDHCGYTGDLCAFAFVDRTDHWWAIEPMKCEFLRLSPKKEALEYWLQNHEDEFGSYAMDLDEVTIDIADVYRGSVYALIFAKIDNCTRFCPRCDRLIDNCPNSIKAFLFRNDREIKPETFWPKRNP